MTIRTLALLLLASWVRAEDSRAPVFTAHEETLKHLVALVRLDTSNPPGNEILAARYLHEACKAEGIASDILVSTGARASLVARLKGSGTKRPLLLMCHTDVVPVERAGWSVDPFGAEIKDGYLYGRGSADVKGMCAAELMVLISLRRRGVRLDRDVIFLAQADEESGGVDRHVDWLVKNHWDKVDAEFGLNEGGFTLWRDGKIAGIDLQCGEKQYLDLTLKAKGTAGHSSLPQPDNAVHSLARAVVRLSERRFPYELSPLSLAYLNAAAREASPELREAIAGLSGPRWEEAAARVDRLAPEYGAILRDTCAATVLKAGYKSNVIPAEAEAAVNCRLLPGRSMAAFVAELRSELGSVEIEYAESELASPAMPIDSELFNAVRAVAASSGRDIPVRPSMAAWSTDSLIFRSRGVKVYGFDPPLTAQDVERAHGDDERLPIEGLKEYTQLLYELVLRMVGSQG